MKRMILAGLLLLGACSANQATVATYDAKQALLTADGIALTYLAQLPCAGTSAVTCVDPAVKARIKVASARVRVARNAADAAIASGQVPDTASLTAAIVAFAAIVAPYDSLVPAK